MVLADTAYKEWNVLTVLDRMVTHFWFNLVHTYTYICTVAIRGREVGVEIENIDPLLFKKDILIYHFVVWQTLSLLMWTWMFPLFSFRISPKNNVVAVNCKQYVEMLAGNVLAPYSFVAVSPSVLFSCINNNYCLLLSLLLWNIKIENFLIVNYPGIGRH
jgi:hypothetical protein